MVRFTSLHPKQFFSQADIFLHQIWNPTNETNRTLRQLASEGTDSLF